MKLPTDLSGQELVNVLLRVGFAVSRQRGSHIILRRGQCGGRSREDDTFHQGKQVFFHGPPAGLGLSQQSGFDFGLEV